MGRGFSVIAGNRTRKGRPRSRWDRQTPGEFHQNAATFGGCPWQMGPAIIWGLRRVVSVIFAETGRVLLGLADAFAVTFA